jgi:hypothetical protein
LAGAPGRDAGEAYIVVTSDQEALAGGTAHLAELSVRYHGEACGDLVKLVAVDVNGDEFNKAEPVRICIDGLSLETGSASDGNGEILGEFSMQIAAKAEDDDRLNRKIRLRIPVTASGSDEERRSATETPNDKGIGGAPIRIAIPDISLSQADSCSEISGQRDQWKLNQRSHDLGMATSKVRIPAAMIAKDGGMPGPRIPIR